MHARDPSDGFCSYAIAMEHAKAMRHEDAIRWFSISASADGSSAYTHFHWARSLEALGREAEAIDAARVGLRTALATSDQQAIGELKALLASWGEVA